ncbi:hypothetical protein ABRY74_05610 [Pseudomonas guariconensis]|uniref:hypothetical protein n=1 Tax=Pseudomonas guariconensis TaxID=1288410 RepID=UPI003EDE83C1
MIRYAVELAELTAEIAAVDPKWAGKAQKRKLKLVAQGHYAETAAIWSTVKPVFMKLQLNKCVFCERQFESPLYGTIEFDLEHFRPKSNVLAWPDQQRHSALNYTVAMGDTSEQGYFWLAYDPLNYAASCKVCNSIFKSNYFPIAGARGAVESSVADLTTERPYLCYPLGTQAEDPEALITFKATVAVPTQAAGPDRLRGQIIIDFFGLNAREQLHRDRARMITVFGPALLAQQQGQASASDLDLIARIDSPNLPHANCLRAFKRLWASDATMARQVFEQCRLYMLSELGTPLPHA